MSIKKRNSAPPVNGDAARGTGLNLSVPRLLIDMSIALTLLAVLEQTGDAKNKDGVNT